MTTPVTFSEMSWAGGVFDSIGRCYLRRVNNSARYICLVEMRSTSFNMLAHFRAATACPSANIKADPSSSLASVRWLLRVPAAHQEEFLTKLLPYLRNPEVVDAASRVLRFRTTSPARRPGVAVPEAVGKYRATLETARRRTVEDQNEMEVVE